MSDHNQDDVNLDDAYKNIVENQENPKPVDLGSINMDKFKPQEAQEADVLLGYHAIPIKSLPSAP